MKTMLITMTMIVLMTAGCATSRHVTEYNVPAHKVIICDYDTLNQLYGRENVALWGVCDMSKRVIWVTPEFWNDKNPNGSVYWHEVRHLLEGKYHK